MDNYTGKVALITGAARGVGREIARGFSSLGVAVAANDINPINLDDLVNRILQAGGIAKGYVFDIAKRMPIEGMLGQVMDHFGRIDFLVNCATVKPDASILDMDEWEFHRTLDVNLGGPFFCIQQVGRLMRAQGSGAIVNVISIYDKGYAAKGSAAYLASQYGLLGLTRAAADELFAYNIRLNSVCRGKNAPTWEDPAFSRWVASLPEVPRGDHSPLVNLVLFLCSDASASLKGQVLPVDFTEPDNGWWLKDG
jgi:3-oxoacyl-[acyl-carrier protein] reductase